MVAVRTVIPALLVAATLIVLPISLSLVCPNWGMAEVEPGDVVQIRRAA